MEEQKDANTEESSPLEGAIASSPEAVKEATEVTETATPQQAETQPQPETEKEETPFNEHPRWKERQAELERLRAQNEQLMNMAQRTQTPQAQPTDPDAGKTPEEKVFWQQVRQEAQKAVSPQIQAGVQEIARLRANLFHNDHPDVKEGTPEYSQIAGKIRQGYLPEDAYRSVMWDKRVENKQQQSTQQQQQRLQQKRQANVASPTSASQQTAQPSKMTFDEEMRQRMNNEWDGTI